MINLWYEDVHYSGRMSGPQKVLISLKKSLDQKGISYSINEDRYKYNFLVHYDAKGQSKHENLEHNSCFIGPQFWPFDQYGKFLIDNPQYYNKLIVPSDWVKDLIVDKFNLSENKISVWPVGIDLKSTEKEIEYDCLIYYKRRSAQELERVQEFLFNKKLSYSILSYGNYGENELDDLTRKSKFCFLLDGTESQGIAVQEIMSTNTPLLVWDVKDWNDNGEEYKVPATSVPYWDSTCGEVFYDFVDIEETFLRFCDKIEKYNPRQFVEENLSHLKSVQILMEIFNAS
jgi:hypothetical protein